MKQLVLVLIPLLSVGLMGWGKSSEVTGPSAGPAQWTRASGIPGAGIVQALTASGTTLLAGTDGGVFRSIDGGLTQATLGGGRMTSLSVPSLTVSGTTLLAGTGNAGIWRYPLQRLAVSS